MIRPRSRRGLVLPFVLLALAVSSLLALAFAGEAWRGLNAARSAVQSDDAGHRAEAASSGALARWSQDSLWAESPGYRQSRTVLVDGRPATIEWQRQQPLVWTLRARSSHAAARRLERSVREHLRAVWLAPPALPVRAALGTRGGVRGAEGTLVSGSDVPVPGSPCGADRDTASVAPVVAAELSGMHPGSWPGAPVWQVPDASFGLELDSAYARIAERLPAQAVDAIPRPLPGTRGWRALRFSAPGGLVLAGTPAWKGLLVVDGDVTLAGPVQLTGVLLVTGRLDASAAALTVHGAVVVADSSPHAVRLGATGRLFYDRCAVQLALATVARPTLIPVARWARLTH